MASKTPNMNPESRKILYLRVNERFISAKERRARVEAGYKVMGYKTLARFCYDNGMYPGSIQKALESQRPSIISIYKLSVALGCSIAYLTEKDYFIKKGDK